MARGIVAIYEDNSGQWAMRRDEMRRDDRQSAFSFRYKEAPERFLRWTRERRMWADVMELS